LKGKRFDAVEATEHSAMEQLLEIIKIESNSGTSVYMLMESVVKGINFSSV
jgi:hypothetical protein